MMMTKASAGQTFPMTAYCFHLPFDLRSAAFPTSINQIKCKKRNV